MTSSILGTVVGAAVIYWMNVLIDRDTKNIGAWIVLVVATWGTCQNLLALGRQVFCG